MRTLSPRATAVVALATAILSACGAPQTAPAATPAPARPWDPGKNGPVDWAETKAAASAKFDKLDANHDGYVDAKELAAANVDKSVLEKGDKDHDGKLTKDEYLALVRTAFEAADPDHDGSVSAAESTTAAGQGLVLLVSEGSILAP
jgi:EF-hand domain pair